jgi:hypothetical protein
MGVWVADAFSFYGVLATADSNLLKRVVVEGGILSLVSENGFCGGEFDHLFIPGILKVLDIPQLLALVSPKPVFVVNPVSAVWKALSQSDAVRALAWTREASAKGTFAVKAGLADAAARSEIIGFLKGGAAE